MFTYVKFRLQRWVRRLGHNSLGVRGGPGMFLQLHVFSKWRQLAMIRRFALGWWGLVAVMLVGLAVQSAALRNSHTVHTPLAGGIYSEALVGSIKNINPILPEGGASADATRLIFSSLTRFNAQGSIEGDLAKSWTISPDGRTYTFTLRQGVKWHDNVPLTSQDIAFTLTAIQNPDTHSPLAHTWQGVKVATPDDHTVVYTLPKPFSPFINATTVGILPRHLLENTEPSSLRVADFNQKPVGSGPFKIESFSTTEGVIDLTANQAYYGGRPLLDGVELRVYPDAGKALDAFTHRQVLGVSRVQIGDYDKAAKLGDLKLHDLAVPDEVGVFLRTTSPVLTSKTVRMALTEATDRNAIAKEVMGGHAVPLYSPLLTVHADVATQKQAGFNLAKAKGDLEADGWEVGRDGVRSKNGQRLVIHLVTQSDSQYVPVAKAIQHQWAKAGASVEVNAVPSRALQQTYIRPRNYDALLYGINVGPDPDVYPYWDSSQAKDPGLNLSAYSSPAADKALESGRTLRDPSLRGAKYKAFVAAWVADNPAVMLYTPTYIYGVSSQVLGSTSERLVDPSDRFYGIEKWAVRSRTVYR